MSFADDGQKRLDSNARLRYRYRNRQFPLPHKQDGMPFGESQKGNKEAKNKQLAARMAKADARRMREIRKVVLGWIVCVLLVLLIMLRLI
ncbi:MAG: hypothetical protein GYB31_19860 [Bacteroidetes bacterium]|nr:hypothetical protein [Bacteroidota bacterium]